MNRQLVETWLQNASLPADIPRTLNDQDMWTVRVAEAELTLYPSDRDDTLYLCASLFNLTGSEDTDFYRHLLQLQSNAELPEGVMFGLDDETNTLLLFARMATQSLDPTRFDRLLNDTLKAVAFLLRELTSTPQTASPQEPDNTPATLTNVSEGSSFSDEDILRLQMMQPIRF